MGMSPNSQIHSAFATILPREIRDAIYFQLWHSCGLRQHIVWHTNFSDERKSHFCRWSCTTKYQVEDQLQNEIEVLRQQLGVPLGDDMNNTHYGRRLQSSWLNHWQCGEHVDHVHGNTRQGHMTSGCRCWKKSLPDSHDSAFQTPYIPMLLSCKLMWVLNPNLHHSLKVINWLSSSECLASIYQSTTFIFTDLMALQLFVGYCYTPPAINKWLKMALPPPAFTRYTRDLELSWTPNFPRIVSCQMPLPGIDRQPPFHDVYDFHWLRLDQFQNLRSIKIWVAARSVFPRIRGIDQGYFSITQLSVDTLRNALSSFSSIDSLTLSTPLAKDIGSEDGYVEELTRSGITVWKRGTGDRFHPFLSSINSGGPLDGLIHIGTTRYVHIFFFNAYVSVVLKRDRRDVRLPPVMPVSESSGCRRLIL